MKTIWKFALLQTDNQLVTMPTGAEILTAQIQDNWICLWAIVDSETNERERRAIEIFGTGHPMRQDIGVSRKYIATAQQGELVWHVFEAAL